MLELHSCGAFRARRTQLHAMSDIDFLAEVSSGEDGADGADGAALAVAGDEDGGDGAAALADAGDEDGGDGAPMADVGDEDGGDGAPIADFLAEASSDEDGGAVQPSVRRRRRRGPPMARPASMYGKTGERTPEQNALLTAKMREKKSQLRFRAAVTAQAAELEKQFHDVVFKSGASRTTMSLQTPRWLSTTHRRNTIGNLQVICHSSSSKKTAPISKLAMAYSGVHCISSLSSMFDCDSTTIEYNQRLVAVAFLDLQAVLAERIMQVSRGKSGRLGHSDLGCGSGTQGAVCFYYL